MICTGVILSDKPLQTDLGMVVLFTLQALTDLHPVVTIADTN
jgi:hypothetical protein